jgi:GAF domain-containing protein
MADQVAVALDNARLFTASQTALEAARRAYGELSREAWAELLRARPDLGFRSDEHQVTPAEAAAWRPEMEQALQRGQTILGDGADAQDKVPLAVPIKVGDQIIGVLDTYKAAATGSWTQQEVALLEEITGQLGLALESARLYEDTQRRAARERLTGEVTARMRETLDIEAVLATAVDEIYRALGLDELTIYLSPEAQDSIRK